jgi:3-methylfumaryl-CoA hydratase
MRAVRAAGEGEGEIDLVHLRTWIGREDIAEDVLTEAAAARFHAGLNFTGAPPRDGDAAPRLIHFALCQPAAPTAALGSDGHVSRGSFLPPVPLPRRMWAGSYLRFTGDLIVGQTIRKRSRVASVAAKPGRSGPLCFVTVEHWIDADGAPRIEERQTLVYRSHPAPANAPEKEAPPAAEGEQSMPLTVTPPMLFRYSALTFNSHRIHYDRAYAIDEEGYPGLVVHGPLQATLLFDLAAKGAGGVPPDCFTFRSHSPLFDFDPIGLHAGPRTAEGQMLWTARSGGPVAMQAEALWT